MEVKNSTNRLFALPKLIVNAGKKEEETKPIGACRLACKFPLQKDSFLVEFSVTCSSENPDKIMRNEV
ncbi:hypothetical protein V6N13_017193 [Hibiscus sabdariffa]|uniref:MSP domain-containing protein n=1 Tax=Hibiscus sabdariffa TaxID=183260 RepID=A0ABR2CYL8_9ROSI